MAMETSVECIAESLAEKEIVINIDENLEDQESSGIVDNIQNIRGKKAENIGKKSGDTWSDVVKSKSNKHTAHVNILRKIPNTHQITNVKEGTKRKHTADETTRSGGIAEVNAKRQKTVSLDDPKTRRKIKGEEEWVEIVEGGVGKTVRIFWLNNDSAKASASKDEAAMESDTEEGETVIGKTRATSIYKTTGKKKIERKLPEKAERVKPSNESNENIRRPKINRFKANQSGGKRVGRVEGEKWIGERLQTVKSKLENRRKMLKTLRLHDGDSGKKDEERFIEHLLTLLMPQGKDKATLDDDNYDIYSESDSKTEKSDNNELDSGNDEAVMNRDSEIDACSEKESSDHEVMNDLNCETDSEEEDSMLNKGDETKKFQCDLLVEIEKVNKDNEVVNVDRPTHKTVKKKIHGDLKTEESLDDAFDDNDNNNRAKKHWLSHTGRKRGGIKNELESGMENFKIKSGDGKLSKNVGAKNTSKCTENPKEIISEAHLSQRAKAELLKVKSEIRKLSKNSRAKKNIKLGTENLKDNSDDGNLDKNGVTKENLDDRKLSKNRDKVKRQVQCTVCKKMYSKRSNLNVHMLTHSGVRDYVCHQCGRDFVRKSSLEQHLLTHTRIKKHECIFCHKRFSSKTFLSQHVVIHTGSMKYECSECHKLFASKTTLKNHSTIHSNVCSFKCDVCGSLFKTEVDYKSHNCKEKDAGTGDGKLNQSPYQVDKIYRCTICDKTYRCRNSFNNHMHVHTGIKEYKCHLCTKDFAFKSKLKQHLLVHDVKKLQCHICHKRYKRKAVLMQHLNLHMGKKHECPECHKQFTSDVGFANHSAIHTGIKTFVCFDCGRRFITKGALVTHQLTHTGARSYMCDLCGKLYKHKQGLKIHRCINIDDVEESNITVSQNDNESNIPAHVGEESSHAAHVDSESNIVTHVSGESNLSTPASNKSNLSTTVRSRPTPRDLMEKKFICSRCSKAFKTKVELANHMTIHTGAKDFKCQTCGKDFSRLSNLEKHMKNIHQDMSFKRRTTCQHCQKVFRNKDDLAYHQKNVHGVVEAHDTAR